MHWSCTLHLEWNVNQVYWDEKQTYRATPRQRGWFWTYLWHSFFFFIIRCAISGKCLLFGSFGDAFFLNERQPTKKSQRLNEWTKKGKPHILYSSLGFRQLQQLLLLHWWVWQLSVSYGNVFARWLCRLGAVCAGYWCCCAADVAVSWDYCR